MATHTSTARLALTHRPRRLRRTEAIRSLVRETRLTPDCFILPLFVCAGEGVRQIKRDVQNLRNRQVGRVAQSLVQGVDHHPIPGRENLIVAARFDSAFAGVKQKLARFFN